MTELRHAEQKELLIVGLSETYDLDIAPDMADQWQRFAPYIGKIPYQIGHTAYGVCCISDAGKYQYICGVEVSDFTKETTKLSRLRIPRRKYVVFEHAGHVSSIKATFQTIWEKWLPASGYKPVDAPFFERYGDDFDPATGSGVVEIWIPVES